MPRTARALGELVRAVVRVDRSRIEPTVAARAVVAMAIPLVVGELVGQPLAGVTASIGALSGGFASFQGTYRTKAGWVMAATGALALSAFVGGTIGHMEGPDIVVTAAWGLGAGMLAAFGTGTLAVGLQAVVGLVVFSQFTFSPGQAGVEAALVLAGGGVQALMVAVLWPLRRFPAERRALGAAYGELAGYASALPTTPTAIGDPAYLEDALKALRDPQPFAAREQMLAYQALGDQAERVRLGLARLSEGRRRLAALGQADYVGELDAAARAAGAVLGEVAASLRGGRAPRGLEDAGRTLDAAVSGLRAATGTGASSQDRWLRAAADESAHGAEALAGQLRGVVRLASVPASGDPAPVMEPWSARLVATGEVVGGTRPRRTTVALGRLHDVSEQLRANLDPSSQAARHAVRLAVALAAAVALSHVFSEGHGYWLPLTVVLVLRADFITTVTRGLARSVGTVAGAGLVTLLLAETRPPHAALIVLTLAFYWVAVAILFANYATFSVMVAALVVTLLAFSGAPAPALAADRSLYTLLGAGLALAIYGLWPTRERTVVADRLASLVEADSSYGRLLFAALANRRDPDPSALHRARVAARLARSNAEASVARWLAEPFHHGPIAPEVANGVLAAMRRFVQAMLALHAALPDHEHDVVNPELVQLGGQIDEALRSAARVLRTREGPRARAALPQLRDSQLDLVASLKARESPTRHDETIAESAEHALVLASETDVMVDAVNSVCHLVGLG